ncbi:SDR family oxidoreductase [Mycobacteroides saopaulense]|uniref:Dehydrogenase n=1 Tax=Mycobacteroides saopaulense TaxID=1578165 RepID=A0A1S1JPM9_9MYCO|nr:SDR family oxidoreductase [Mycobacteroides saopaulense]ALR12351.1 dehydrogenase [Mycobacteroides saopaulense]OHT88092.1 dehydrogenase [Mycobacteroides saopaulense]OHU06433.1 dehydrogenase [Mycobacteroides saopaulense]ORB57906.1 dehydrogenase [Mycobacteroides saopaulense]
MDINGSVAIVTGAGSGIGQALAWGLADAGAKVVASDIDAEAAAHTASQRPGKIVSLRADASSVADIASLIALAENEFGPVDLYAANAGIGCGLGLDIGETAWDLAIDVNLRSHVRAATMLVPGWVERGRGYFLSVASAAGLLTQIGSPAYSVTKHAAVGFAEWLSITYGDKGIGVSCLCPMGVKTALLDGLTQSDDPDVRVAGTSITAAGEVLEPAAVAALALAAIREEKFLILPHPQVLDMYRQKGADYGRWIAGMRRYQGILEDQIKH